jgi:transposase InsO family protein
MKNLFEAATTEEVRERLAQMRPDSERLWGKMSPAQALAHCSAAMEMAVGLTFPPRSFMGRLFGRRAKSSILNEKPMRRNLPTGKSFVVNDKRDFAAEKQRLHGLIDRFAAGGPAGCTKHPHCFFGPTTPEEWAALNYKHLDHHLRQFGV